MKIYLESCLDDDFEGWNGDTIYELADGTKWELVSYTYSYTYSYRPKAIIWQKDGAYFLEVEGMSNKQEVRQIY